MNILVTGASRGIGFELVKLFVHSGHTVAALSRNHSGLRKLEQECHSNPSGGRLIVLQADLENSSSIKEACFRFKDQITQLDILVNNAGALINKPFETITSNDLQKAYQVNVFSVVQLIQELLPLLGRDARSHVVNISSMGGFQGSAKFAGLSAYSSSKGALACLTECLAEEFKDRNIAFNCLALGAVQTEMLEEAFPGYKAPVSPQQMAQFIYDFAQNSHNLLNGKVLPISLSTP